MTFNVFSVLTQKCSLLKTTSQRFQSARMNFIGSKYRLENNYRHTFDCSSSYKTHAINFSIFFKVKTKCEVILSKHRGCATSL